VTPHLALEGLPGTTWQVLCGDPGHYRCGFYSPAATKIEDLEYLERHSCPEIFLLLTGSLMLLLDEGAEERLVPLPLHRPILVTTWHAGFCPDGAHTGTAFVVERDRFTTWYRERKPSPGRS